MSTSQLFNSLVVISVKLSAVFSPPCPVVNTDMSELTTAPKLTHEHAINILTSKPHDILLRESLFQGRIRVITNVSGILSLVVLLSGTEEEQKWQKNTM